MRTIWTLPATLTLVAVALVVAPIAHGQTPAQPSTAQPSTPAAPVDKTLITVGASEIHQSDVNALLAQVEPYKRSAYEERALSQLTRKMLNREFVADHKLPVDEQKFQQVVDGMRKRFEDDLKEVRTRMALNEFVREQVTEEKIKQYMEANPQFFDGTTVEVSRILIKCAVHESSADQLAARDRLERIRQDIKDRKIIFSAAAASYSDCPSKAKSGQLGKLEFGGPANEMILKIAAFMTSENQISPVIRTLEGWEILLVTQIERGDGTPRPWKDPASGKSVRPEALAQRAIISLIENKIFRSIGVDCPIVKHETQAPKAAAAAAAAGALTVPTVE